MTKSEFKALSAQLRSCLTPEEHSGLREGLGRQRRRLLEINDIIREAIAKIDRETIAKMDRVVHDADTK